MPITVEVLLVLFFVALIAGWVDTIAGGGGLIALPALLLAGVPPVSALATNKCQGFVGTMTATLTLVLKRKLRFSSVWPLMLFSAAGAAVGTVLVHFVSTDWLSWAVPLLLISVAVYFLMSPNLGAIETEARLSDVRWRNTIVPAIGFYDGFFGPGTGSFFAASGILFRGKNLIEATVVAKPLNFASNIASLVIFAFSGHVIWLIGVVMMCGQMLGAVLGAHSIYWGGARLIRPLVIIMCIALSIRQLVDLL